MITQLCDLAMGTSAKCANECLKVGRNLKIKFQVSHVTGFVITMYLIPWLVFTVINE